MFVFNDKQWIDADVKNSVKKFKASRCFAKQHDMAKFPFTNVCITKKIDGTFLVCLETYDF